MSARGIRGFVTKHWAWLVLLAVLVLTSAVRVRLLDVPLERDEGEYAYTAQLLLDGHAPFDGAYSLKLPGTAYMYAASFLAFGESVTAIRLGLLLVNVVTVLLIFSIGVKVGGKLVGTVAGAAYALASLSVAVLGFTANTEHYAVLFIAAGALMLLHYRERPHLWRAVVAGMLFGVAILMKQHSIFFLPWAAIWVVWYSQQRSVSKRGIMHGLALACTSIAPLVLLVLYVWMSGNLSTMIFWAWSYASAYTGIMPITAALRNFFLGVSGIVLTLGGIIVLALFGFFSSMQDRKSDFPEFLIPWTVCSLIAISVGYFFRGHYFILGLPALCVCAGLGAHMLLTHISRRSKEKAAVRLGITFIILIFLWVPFTEGTLWFHVDEQEFSAKAYPLEHFSEYRAFGEELKHFVQAGDSIAIVGSEPELLFYSQTRSVTGFLYGFPFIESQPYRAAMMTQFIHEVEQAKPEWLVVVEEHYSWGAEPWRVSHPIWQWLEQYKNSYTRVVKSNLLLSKEVPVEWRTSLPEDQNISLYKRHL